MCHNNQQTFSYHDASPLGRKVRCSAGGEDGGGRVPASTGDGRGWGFSSPNTPWGQGR